MSSVLLLFVPSITVLCLFLFSLFLFPRFIPDSLLCSVCYHSCTGLSCFPFLTTLPSTCFAVSLPLFSLSVPSHNLCFRFILLYIFLPFFYVDILVISFPTYFSVSFPRYTENLMFRVSCLILPGKCNYLLCSSVLHITANQPD